MLGRRIALVIALGGVALGLSSCGGSSSDALGHKACVEVNQSVKLYDESLHATSTATASSEASDAEAKLRAALQPAALAGTSDGNWQALMTTLSESSRVSEKLLIPALQAQCAATLSS